MKAKLPIIVSLYFLVLILHSCGPDCDCPPVLPFFDYQQLDILSLGLIEENDTSGFYFDFYPADVDFLTVQRPWSLGILNSAYACSCIEGGEEGAKFPITDITIRCDKDWNPDYIAGENLKDLFLVRATSPDMPNPIPLNDLSAYPDIDLFENPIQLMITTAPDSIGPNISYGLSFEFTKSNGEVADGQADIIWE